MCSNETTNARDRTPFVSTQLALPKSHRLVVTVVLTRKRQRKKSSHSSSYDRLFGKKKSTQYVSYDAEGNAVEQVIIRDNCTTGTYCDSNYKCITSKPIGQTCQQDRECLSGTCSNSGVCVNGPDVFHTIPAWLWAVVGVAVFLFVLLILGLLWVLHRYQSKKEREKIEKFFGDNEEFAKYAMLEHDELQDGTIAPLRKRTDSRTSMVFLATPDYNESAALGTTRPLSWRHNSSTTKLRSSYSPSPHTSTLDLPRSSTPDLNRLSNSEQPR